MQGRERILALISALKTARSLEEVRRIHANAAERRLDTVLHVASSLVNSYSRFTSVHEARKVFDSIDSPDVILWNLLIRGYVISSQLQEALVAFQQMKAQGCVPDAQTFVSVLKACAAVENKLQRLEMVMAIHSEAESSNSVDSYVASTLIDLYSKCGSMRDAERVFDSMESHNSVSWTVLVTGYASNRDFKQGFEFFLRMLGEGVEMDPHAFVAGIQALNGLVSEHRKKKSSDELAELLEKAMALHREAELRSCTGDVFVGSSLVDLYSKCGSMQDAQRVFDKLELSDVVSHTALIFGYAHSGENQVALQMFARMAIAPNSQTFVAALHACSNLATEEQGVEFEGRRLKLNSLEKAFALHREVLNGSVESDLCVCSTLIDLYSKCGSMFDATRVFQQMPVSDLVSWTALMLGLAQNGQGEQALELFSRGRSRGFAPDDQTFVAALKACTGSSASLELGRGIHWDICRCGLDESATVLNSLVDFYSKCGKMSEAQRVFDSSRTLRSEVILWNSLITGYSRQGNTNLVLDLFEEMKQVGVKSDGITKLAVLNACCHAGLVEEGKKFFGDGGDPELELEHYHCMVDMLGRANRLDEAMEIVKQMPHQANAFTWTIVLSSCQKWKNVRIGKMAYDRLLALDERLASTYVLMSNFT